MVSITDHGGDPTGNEPIDGPLSDALSAADVVTFPDGEYLVSGDLDVSGNGWELRGTNATLVLPDEGGGLDFSGDNWTFDGFEVDYRGQDGFGECLLGEPGDGGWTFGNVVFRGTHVLDEKDVLLVPSIRSGTQGHLHDVYAHEGNADGDEDGMPKLMWHDEAMAGTLLIERLWAERWSENTIYASDMDGDIIIRDSYFRNTNTGCIRVSEQTEVTGCVFVADGPIPGQWNEERKGATEFKGVWCNFDRGSGDGRVDMSDCDFFYTHSSGVGSGVEVDGPGDALVIDNCRFHATFDVRMIDGAGENVTFSGTGNVVSGGFEANVSAIETTRSEAPATNGSPPMPNPPPLGSTPNGDAGDGEPPTPTHRLRIGSVDTSPAMWYEFTAPGEVTPAAGSLEGTDVIEQQDGSWAVEGVTGPSGSDTYTVAASALTDLGIFVLELNGSDNPDDWTRTDRPVPPANYELLWDGDPVAIEDIVAPPAPATASFPLLGLGLGVAAVGISYWREQRQGGN